MDCTFCKLGYYPSPVVALWQFIGIGSQSAHKGKIATTTTTLAFDRWPINIAAGYVRERIGMVHMGQKRIRKCAAAAAT